MILISYLIHTFIEINDLFKSKLKNLLKYNEKAGKKLYNNVQKQMRYKVIQFSMLAKGM